MELPPAPRLEEMQARLQPSPEAMATAAMAMETATATETGLTEMVAATEAVIPVTEAGVAGTSLRRQLQS